MDLHHKTAIVTGASAGLGVAFAEHLIRAGATVYGLARRNDRLQELRGRLGAAFHPVPLDVTDRAGIDAWVAATFSDTHRPDLLVNNAGIGHFAEIDQLDPAHWDAMLAVNLTGVFNLTHALVPHLKANPAVTHIVNIASVAGRIGNPRLAGYNATKYGLRGFSDALMKELRGHGIKVTCLFPGSIATDFNGGIRGSSAQPLQAEDLARVLIDVVRMPDHVLIDEVVLRPLNP